MWEHNSSTVRLPANVSVREEDGRLTITLYWFRLGHAVILAIAMTIGGLLASGAVEDEAGDMPPIPIVACVTAAMGYWGLAGVLNRTRVVATAHQLTIDIVPIPWLGYFERPAEEIAQLYVDQSSHLEKSHWNFGNTGWGYNRVTHFNVMVRLTDGSEKAVITRLRTGREAKLVERLVELYMGIENTYVAGEAFPMNLEDEHHAAAFRENSKG